MLLAMLMGPMPVVEALARIEELGAAADRSPPLRLQVLPVRAQLEAMLGRFEHARALISEAKGLAAEFGLLVTLGRIALEAGPIEMLAGRPADAERELRPAYEGLRRMENWGHLASVVPVLVDALLAQGREDEGLRLTEVIAGRIILEDVDGQVGWRRVRAKLLARSGALEEAEHVAREATEMAERTDYLSLRAQALDDLAEVLRRAGQPLGSRVALDEAISLHERKGNVVAAATLRHRLEAPRVGAS